MLCFFALAMFVSSPAVGTTIKDLYTAEVLVPSQGKPALARDAKKALLQVLVRVSGSMNVGNNQDVAAALGHPADYYYQYGYDATDRTLTEGGQQVPARILKIAFEPSAVAKLLRGAGFPVWGSSRPSVLVWIAVSDGGTRRILTDADQSVVLQSLEDEAKLRGLPLLFPLLDLEDTSKVSTGAVWGLFLDRIDAASARYNPDVVLAARVQQDVAGQWTASWSYRIDDKWQQGGDTATDAADLVDTMVDGLADQLAGRYAVGSARGTVMVKVDGIDNLQDYANVTAYLQSLTPVVDLNVVDVNGDEALFRLSTEGQSQQLMEIINLDQKMVLQNPGDATNPIQYRWVGK